MKKKLLAMLLAIVMVFSLTACGTLDSKYDDRTDLFQDWTKSSSSAKKSATTTTKLNLPAELIALSGLAQGDDLSAFIADGGYSGAKWNDDGSIEITMKTADYEKLKAEINAETKAELEALVGAEGTEYITAVDCSETLDSVKVSVIRADYEANKELGIGLEFTIGLLVNFARHLIGEESAVISIVDSETDEEIEAF